MSGVQTSNTMKIAVEGCCHGELDAIYGRIAELETQHDYKVDLLLICGDFQAARNRQDLQCMARPKKYKDSLADFHKYYTGEEVAPILTIVIGGNHEASNYMWELYYGGWLAKNIYFLGHAGAVQVNGIKIAGASGIFKGYHFKLGHHEKLPYNSSMIRSIYHIREYDIRRLSLLTFPNIFLSHDWPQAIDQHGDFEDLVKRKPHFESDVQSGKLGAPPLMGLLQNLKPQWWLSAHLHVRFEATYNHTSPGVLVEGQSKGPTSPPSQPIQKVDDDLSAIDASYSKHGGSPPTVTRFLALDQCRPERHFLEVVDVEAPLPNATPVLSFDPEWLAINRAFHPWFSTTRSQRPFPDKTKALAMVAKEVIWVDNNIRKNEQGLILVEDWQTFVQTAPGPGVEDDNMKTQQPPVYVNPQTTSFCKMLDITDKVN